MQMYRNPGTKKRLWISPKPFLQAVKAYFLTVSTVVVVVLTVVSCTVESLTEVSTSVTTVEESVIEVSVVSPFFSELQAATDKEIAKAKKPNLNMFFI
jgi:hypothetical protein